MKRKLTSILQALVLVVALIPAHQTRAIDSEIHYTVTFVCIVGPNPGVIGEWTRDCNSELTGWGTPPYQCEGNPSYCCETDVTFGDPCD